MTEKITVANTLERLSRLPKIEDQSVKDWKFFSEVGAALMENELEFMIKNKKWVAGVIIMTSMLHFAGKSRLAREHKGSISRGRIKTFAQTNKYLFDSNIIDEQTYRKLEKIRERRNNFAHELLRYISFSEKPNPDLEQLIREAIAIIKTIFS